MDGTLNFSQNQNIEVNFRKTEIMIKIETLRCFVAVAQSGNLADAALKLGRSTAAVSMKLKQLETHLDGRLFEAERKSVLTALGAFTLEEAIRELSHFDRTVSTIEEFARSETGYVSIAAVPSVAAAILPRVMHHFLQDHPGVHVDIRDMDSAAVLRELEQGRVELGMATGVGAGAGIFRDDLFSDAYGVVCRIDHALTQADLPLSWEALEPWPFIANGLCEHISHERFQQVFKKSHLTVRNTTSLLALVGGGVGVTVLPRLVVNTDDPEITFLPVSDPAARRTVEILRGKRSSLSPAARLLEKVIYRTVGEMSLS